MADSVDYELSVTSNIDELKSKIKDLTNEISSLQNQLKELADSSSRGSKKKAQAIKEVIEQKKEDIEVTKRQISTAKNYTESNSLINHEKAKAKAIRETIDAAKEQGRTTGDLVDMEKALYSIYSRNLRLNEKQQITLNRLLKELSNLQRERKEYNKQIRDAETAQRREIRNQERLIETGNKLYKSYGDQASIIREVTKVASNNNLTEKETLTLVRQLVNIKNKGVEINSSYVSSLGDEAVKLREAKKELDSYILSLKTKNEVEVQAYGNVGSVRKPMSVSHPLLYKANEQQKQLYALRSGEFAWRVNSHKNELQYGTALFDYNNPEAGWIQRLAERAAVGAQTMPMAKNRYLNMYLARKKRRIDMKALDEALSNAGLDPDEVYTGDPARISKASKNIDVWKDEASWEQYNLDLELKKARQEIQNGNILAGESEKRKVLKGSVQTEVEALRRIRENNKNKTVLDDKESNGILRLQEEKRQSQTDWMNKNQNTSAEVAGSLGEKSRKERMAELIQKNNERLAQKEKQGYEEALKRQEKLNNAIKTSERDIDSIIDSRSEGGYYLKQQEEINRKKEAISLAQKEIEEEKRYREAVKNNDSFFGIKNPRAAGYEESRAGSYERIFAPVIQQEDKDRRKEIVSLAQKEIEEEKQRREAVKNNNSFFGIKSPKSSEYEETRASSYESIFDQAIQRENNRKAVDEAYNRRKNNIKIDRTLVSAVDASFAPMSQKEREKLAHDAFVAFGTPENLHGARYSLASKESIIAPFKNLSDFSRYKNWQNSPEGQKQAFITQEKYKRFDKLRKEQWLKEAGLEEESSSSSLNRMQMILAYFGGSKIREAVDGLIDFRTNLSDARAVIGASAEQMNDLTISAEKLGKTTVFTAGQAAESIKYLGMAGLKTDEILKVLPDTLNLASAGSIDLGRAADIATNVMSAFNMDAKEFSTAVDAIAFAAANSNTNVEQLAQGMKYAGPSAHAAGVSLKSTTAILGTLANAGIQASTGGTSLRMVLSSLSKAPTKNAIRALKEMGLSYDEVSLKNNNLIDVVKKLSERSITLGQAIDIFGVRAANSIMALTSNVDDLERLNLGLENSAGSAKKMSEIKLDNISGDLTLLASGTSNLVIQLSKLTGAEKAFREVTQSATGFINIIGSGLEKLQQMLGMTREKIVVLNEETGKFEEQLEKINPLGEFTSEIFKEINKILGVTIGLNLANWAINSATGFNALTSAVNLFKDGITSASLMSALDKITAFAKGGVLASAGSAAVSVPMMVYGAYTAGNLIKEGWDTHSTLSETEQLQKRNMEEISSTYNYGAASKSEEYLIQKFSEKFLGNVDASANTSSLNGKQIASIVRFLKNNGGSVLSDDRFDAKNDLLKSAPGLRDIYDQISASLIFTGKDDKFLDELYKDVLNYESDVRIRDSVINKKKNKSLLGRYSNVSQYLDFDSQESLYSMKNEDLTPMIKNISDAMGIFNRTKNNLSDAVDFYMRLGSNSIKAKEKYLSDAITPLREEEDIKKIIKKYKGSDILPVEIANLEDLTALNKLAKNRGVSLIDVLGSDNSEIKEYRRLLGMDYVAPTQKNPATKKSGKQRFELSSSSDIMSWLTAYGMNIGEQARKDFGTSEIDKLSKSNDLLKEKLMISNTSISTSDRDKRLKQRERELEIAQKVKEIEAISGAESASLYEKELRSKYEIIDATEKANEKLKKTQSLYSDISSGIAEAVVQAHNFRDAFQNLGDVGVNVIKKLASQWIENKMENMLFGLSNKGNKGGKSFFSPLDLVLASAKGNVFSNGYHLTAYAKGGIVNKPTVFPMAKGMGLMGEAGAEAVMPLKRTASGDLGVQVAGGSGRGGIIISPQITINAEGGSKEENEDAANRINEKVQQAMDDMMTVHVFSPSVIPSVGSSVNSSARVLVADFGDGYSQRAADGINNIDTTVSLQWNNLTGTQANSIDNFFMQMGGYESFYYTLPTESIAKKWTCEKWDKSYQTGELMAEKIKSVIQSFAPGKLVELFMFDLTPLGGPVTYWSNTVNGDNPIVFNGNVYIPRAMEATGFEMTGSGTIPQPTVKLFADAGIRAAMIQFQDFLGAKVTRIKTFSRFLDGEPDADPDQRFPDEVYYVAQKESATKDVVSFKLMSALEVNGMKLPRRICLKDTCPLRYRKYDSARGVFVYTPVADGGCPWDGTVYFTAEDNSTLSPSQDRCGKKLNSCRLRYGKNVLPFLGFPGIANAAVTASKKEAPKEMCGVFTYSSGFIQLTNSADSPEEGFVIKEYEKIFANMDDVIAVVHSHPDKDCEPSSLDLISQKATCIPWCIISLKNGVNCLFWEDKD
ncbi:unnamed protein product [Cylicocyclus nassatus]|uniref:Phage tail tape measure protein n=1 Tax=Cylicocyclus nassatus TaxID=53992 RepID=A0AA36HH18_CYLNA|nr:unnamed protein product [Cylicocyclus nassatus]